VPLPPRAFYSLSEAAVRWGCTPHDIVGWAAVGRLDIITGIAPVRCGAETIAGCVVVPGAEVMPMFRRCGGSKPTSWRVRRLRPWTDGTLADGWRLISDPANGIEIAAADLMISAVEVTRFEEECDLVRRPLEKSGRYDWEAFYIALIKYVFEGGLPETQNELVQMMQDWFLRRSETGDGPDESTIRKRINPIWRELRG
jgi:hypothetical protein